MTPEIPPPQTPSDRGSFQFRQFKVFQDQCGMKVGTDAIAFAALVSIGEAQRLLEVGVGTGVVSLILAQRTQPQGSHIEGIEIEPCAAQQAAENFRASPWSSRLIARNIAYQDYCVSEKQPKFDRIVCNPPFFNGSPPLSAARHLARHSDSLPMETLFRKSGPLLNTEGQLALILPSHNVNRAIALAKKSSFYLARTVSLIPQSGGSEKRRIMEFTRLPTSRKSETLTIEHSHHVYTEAYQELTQNYYLPRTFQIDT